MLVNKLKGFFMLEIAKYFCLIYKYICIIYTSIHFTKIILNIIYLKRDETININFIDKKEIFYPKIVLP